MTSSGEERAEAKPGMSEDALLVRARAGDQDAFAALYSGLAPSVLTWARLRIRPTLRTHFEPADVVQEVWFRAWKGIEHLDPETPLRPWIFRIAKNVLLEGLRRLRAVDTRRVQGGSSDRGRAVDELADPATTLSRRLDRDEGLARFVEWVEDLDENDRKLLVHVGLEGLNHQEAAERTGISTEALHKRWQRLVARLRERGLPEGMDGLVSG